MKRGVLCKYCVPYKDSNKIYCKLKKYDVEGYKCDKGHCSDHSFEPAAMVVIGVGRCDECPCVETTRTPEAGYAFDYWCKACRDEQDEPRKITGYVEWDSEIPPVPGWCPFKIEEDDFYETVD